MTRHKKHGIKLQSMYQWHRYIGVTTAVFIIILAVTGIMLNHTDRLELNKKFIQSNWLLNYYGISAPENINSYQAGKHWVSLWGSKLYLDTHMLGETDKNIIGAVYYQKMVVIAQENSLSAYTIKGELIDRLVESDGVPSGIEAIGITNKNKLALRVANKIFTTNQDLLVWRKTSSAISVWSGTAPLPKNLYQNILERYLGNIINLERVILDLHSGRLLGIGGVYFMDIVAIMMIFLASSGFWLWALRIYNKKKHKRKKFH